MQKLKLSFILLLFSAIVLTSCADKSKDSDITEKPKQTVFQGNTMGTTYSIKQLGDSIASQAQIDSALDVIDRALSSYNPNSYITAFNKNLPLDTFEPHLRGHFNEMVWASLMDYTASDGAFDPSASLLFNYWGFGEDGPKPKQDSSLFREAMMHKGMEKLRMMKVKGETATPKGFNDVYFEKTDPEIMLNFNAIAKGYGVDVISELIRSKGCKNFMVEIGGEVYCGGNSQTGEPWKIGINTPDPKASKSDVTRIVQLSNQALATSGNYRNFYVKDGKKYGHSIDPRTGKPSENNVLSASILAPSCAQADAWATIAMVLGIDSTLDLIQNGRISPDFAAYIIYEKDGEIRDTTSHAELLQNMEAVED